MSSTDWTFDWLELGPLKEKRLDTRKSSAVGRFETDADPYFGLDWTRNLALAAETSLGPLVKPLLGGSDIVDAPFALVVSGRAAITGGSEFQDFPPYAPDAGFVIGGLPSLLWWLAIKEPGQIYLASVSRLDPSGLRQHYHVSILLPWFDEGRAFHVDVFDGPAETSFLAFLARVENDDRGGFSGEMVHLVRIRAARDFDPPLLPQVRLP